MAVSYVEQVRTGYRPVMRSREVEVVVNRLVTKPVEEKFNYNEYETITTPEKRSVTHYRCVTEQVPYTFNVQVPVYTPTKVKQTFYTCVPTPVVENVPVCVTVPCPMVDPCTGCTYTVCQRVTVMKPVTRTVMKMVPQEREVVVQQVSWKTQEQKSFRLVSKMVSEVHHFTVNVVSYKAVPKVGTRTYYVCETVPTKTRVTQTYCELQQYQYTVQVPVCTPIMPPAPAPCVGPVAAHH